MKPNVTATKYRLSVLLDLSKASKTTLTNAVQLAKAISGSVEVFFLKTPSDVVTRENQLTVVREDNQDGWDSKSKMERLVMEVGQQENFHISIKNTKGNLKSGLKEYLAEVKPNVLVLEKKRSKLMNLAGNGVHVLITSGEAHTFHSLEDISLGVFDDLKDSDFEIIQDLKRESKEPIRMFSVKREKGVQKEVLGNTISYVFSEGANAMDAVVSYVSRTNTKLFCIPKAQKSRLSFQNPIQQVVRKLDVPVLIMS